MVVSFLLAHSFLPSVLDARNVSAVHGLEDTLVKVQSALAPTRKKPASLDALPTDVHARASSLVLVIRSRSFVDFGARTVAILGAFGDKVGYDKLFRHSGPYAVQSRWAKNFVVAVNGFECMYTKV